MKYGRLFQLVGSTSYKYDYNQYILFILLDQNISAKF